VSSAPDRRRLSPDTAFRGGDSQIRAYFMRIKAGSGAIERFRGHFRGLERCPQPLG